jgi:hypothetical protein
VVSASRDMICYDKFLGCDLIDARAITDDLFYLLSPSVAASLDPYGKRQTRRLLMLTPNCFKRIPKDVNVQKVLD